MGLQPGTNNMIIIDECLENLHKFPNSGALKVMNKIEEGIDIYKMEHDQLKAIKALNINDFEEF